MDTVKKLLYLYRMQTEEERMVAQTIQRNGRGFNGTDAQFCSSLAERVLNGAALSAKQLQVLEKILPKYSHQFEDGEWKNEPVPSAVRAESEKSDKTDVLDVDPASGGLVFYPVTYPSKQIRLIAPFYWTGKCWMQSRPNVSGALVKDIRKMFPATVLTERLQEVLKPKEIQLSERVVNSSLYDFQKEAVSFIVVHKKALLGLAPGLGKTACAIYGAGEVGAKKILVISPLSLMYNWENEIRKWVNEETNIVYKQDCAPTDRRWTVTNYDTMRLHLESFFATKWDCVILDETILIKNRKALRTKATKNLLQAIKPRYVWLLSGAPVSRMYDDLWAQLNILDPGRFSGYWRFTQKYCYVQQNQWGWQILGNLPDAAERLKADLSDIYFARTQEQVLDLPDWIFDDLHVRMDKQQDTVYGQMEDRFVAELADGQMLLAPNVLAQMTRLVQLASNPLLVGGKNVSAKWTALEELLEYEELPAIVWTSFIETAEMLKERLKFRFRVGALTGDTKSEERQATVDKFQKGEIDILIAHPGVGKFGFTLTAARTAVYLERNYNGDDYYQSLHRIRRIGTTERPHVIHLLSDRMDGSGTVDAVIGKILKSRKENVLKLSQGELKAMFEGDKK